MLSNKLTFSLVLVLVFALVAIPAMAQRANQADLGAITKDMFAVIGNATAPGGILATNGGPTVVDGADEMPDLAELFRFGGTIELHLKGAGDNDEASKPDAAASAKGASAGATAEEKKASKWHKVVISEIMWGLDDGVDTSQWIEIYNHTGADIADTDLRIVYYPGRNTAGPDVVIETDFGEADPNTDVDAVWVLVDRVSTLDRFGAQWDLKGQSGNSDLDQDPVGSELKDLISMFRKINIVDDKYEVKDGVLQGLGDGTVAGSWDASPGRINMTGYHIGTPDTYPTSIGGLARTTGKAPASIAAGGVIINEVRNDTSEANLDWVELYHYNDAADAVAQNIENWQLSVVEKDDGTERILVEKLPKYKLKPDSYLVIYNRDPGDTVLAGGVDIAAVGAGTQVNKGASHMYFVSDKLDLASDKKFLIVLRNGAVNAKNPTEKIVDYIGSGFYKVNKKVGDVFYNTDIFPLNGWAATTAQGGDTTTFASANQTWGRQINLLADKGGYRPDSRADDRGHGDDWTTYGPMAGVGYDRDVDLNSAPGTPGYANVIPSVLSDDRDNAVATDDYAFSGMISISEIMYDAGPRWNLVQWIELYNSSMTEAINIGGWTMEIRNKEDVESYVDSSFEFAGGTEILPNQTLLLVSGSGANDVDSSRVYNLYQHHRADLGLLARDSVLLSRTGFYLRLNGRINEGGESKMVLVDEAGNVDVDGATRSIVWELEARDPAARQSLIRQYGSRAIDGTSDSADDGTMEASWVQSDIAGAGLAYYGHRNDVGTPGFRLGGPLPVSLATFRPLRDKATGEVVITWVTESELNNAGFNILRADSKDGEFKVINLQGMIAGHGTTSEKHVYTYTDKNAKPNVAYYYQIEDVSLNGNRTTLRTTHMRGNVNASGKLATTWSDLKLQK